jgi:hypothetical protein
MRPRQTTRWVLRYGPPAIALGAWIASSCAPSGFQSVSLVQNGIRILTSSASEPYAAPGDHVTVSVLAYDGRNAAQRAQNTEPMRVYWLPFLCEDPPQDAYYACFPQFAVAAKDGGSPISVADVPAQPNEGAAGASGCAEATDGAAEEDADTQDAGGPISALDAGGPISALDAGSPISALDAGGPISALDASGPISAIDASGLLITGDAAALGASDAAADVAGIDAEALEGAVAEAATPTVPVVSSFPFQIPRDAVTAHPLVAGTAPYGLLIAFNVACAGQLRLLAEGNANPQAPPVQCVDPSHGDQPVGPDSYVFGFSRIYAYPADAGVSNANPVLLSVDVETPGMTQSIPVTGGPSVYRSTQGQPLVLTRCDPALPCPNVKVGPVLCPTSWERNGARHEEIWADYFTTVGGFSDSSRLLYDPNLGLIGPPSYTDSQFQVPTSSGDGFIWIVVHDDRGGASWVSLPVHLNDP